MSSVFYEEADFIGYWVSTVESGPLGRTVRPRWRLRKPKGVPHYEEFIVERIRKFGIEDHKAKTLSTFA